MYSAGSLGTTVPRHIRPTDQLNPACAKYYSGSEAHALLEDAGFADVRIYRRHGYSWTVMGIKQ
jgi:hypothetical protein